MYKVKLNDEFKSDLNDISEYIFRISFSKEITQKISDEITKKLLNLIIFPNMYQNTYKDFKTIQIKSYKVFYKVDETKKEVIVYRVLWASRNFREYV